jgi:hypothetical protein
MGRRILRTAVISTTPEVQRVTDLLELAARRFRLSLRTVPSIGKYEASDEALSILYLMTRNVEAIVLLARQNLALVGPAMAIGRATFEQGLRVKWMLYPTGLFEREARWLAMVKESEESYRKFANGMEAAGEGAEIVTGLRETEAMIREFRLAVETALPDGIKRPKRVPDFLSIAKSIGEESKYFVYSFASQYVHGTITATELYRRNLGIHKEFGEYIRPSSWGLPFLLAWYGFGTAAVYFLSSVGGDVEAFLPGSSGEDLDHAIRILRTGKQSP